MGGGRLEITVVTFWAPYLLGLVRRLKLPAAPDQRCEGVNTLFVTDQGTSVAHL